MPEQGYGHAERANDVIALIEGLALERPVLLGHSMGGLSTAVVASGAAQLIRGAILEEPALIGAEEWDSPLHSTWPLEHAADRERSLEELIERGKGANPR